MPKPKALVISHSNIAEDPRVLRHMSVISEEFEVHTVGYGDKPLTSEKHFRVADEVRFLPRSPKQLLNMQIGRSTEVARDSAFSQAVINLIKSEKNSYDLVQINDVHALVAGFEVKSDAKVWVDMHEYAPLEGEHDWRWNLAFSGYARKLCMEYLPLADALSTVSDGIARRYSTELNKDVYLIRNSHPFVSGVKKQPSSEEPLNYVHVGVALKARKIENMVEAFSDLSDDHQLHLMLVPTDLNYYRKLESIAGNIPNVSLVPPVPNADVINNLSSFDAGIITIPPTSFNYQHGLPNKFFQFVQARLPIVAGPLPEISKLVSEFNVGWVTQSFEADSIADTVSQIDRDSVYKTSDSLEVAAKALSADVDDKVRREVVTSIFG